MRLVASKRFFQPVAAASNDSIFLVCVTASVCYSEAYVGKAAVFERTADGGVTWRREAAWPLGGEEQNTPSCPTTRMCAAVGASGIAVTTDGFAHLRVPVTLPPGVTLQGSLVSCATADSSVVPIAGASGPTFVYTGNGGQTWAGASVPSIACKGACVWQLRCDKNGYCIAMVIGGTNTAGTLTVLRSADSGRTWTASRTYSEPDAQTLQLSCGDGRQCMLVSDTGYLVQATATAGGSVTVAGSPSRASARRAWAPRSAARRPAIVSSRHTEVALGTR
jgi:photosystem II stability/assembly factor-like uncharacterized protein